MWSGNKEQQQSAVSFLLPALPLAWPQQMLMQHHLEPHAAWPGPHPDEPEQSWEPAGDGCFVGRGHSGEEHISSGLHLTCRWIQAAWANLQGGLGCGSGACLGALFTRVTVINIFWIWVVTLG